MLRAALRRSSWIFAWVRPLARRDGAAVAVVAAVAFAGCLLLAWRGGVRPPAVHDEFSYLLAADTFAHGRLTNPSPPAFRSFETEHVLVRPSYMSKYPPAQGVALAIGLLLSGQAILGVWLSVAAACAAIAWMLLGWVPRRWALAGGLIAVYRLVFLGGDAWWSQRYWGGAVAAMGGALLFGAWRRLSTDGRPRDAALLGIALVVLANSRPFEGFVISLPVLAMLLWQAAGPTGAFLRSPSVLRPLGTVLLLGAVLTGAYNHAVTGHFWELPHLTFQRQYTAAPQFLWLDPGPTPAYGNRELAAFFVARELNMYREMRDLHHWLAALEYRWSDAWRFFLGVPLVFAGVALPWALRDRWTRRAVVCLATLAVGMASLTWYFPHYAAPATAPIVLVLVECLRRVRALGPGGWRVGRLLLPVTAVLCLAQTARFVRTYEAPQDWSVERQRLQQEFLHEGGQHLVVVRYAGWHNNHNEWVYNDADLAHAPILWARDLGPEPNRELIAAFPGRKVWLLEPDTSKPALRPFRPGAD